MLSRETGYSPTPPSLHVTDLQVLGHGYVACTSRILDAEGAGGGVTDLQVLGARVTSSISRYLLSVKRVIGHEALSPTLIPVLAWNTLLPFDLAPPTGLLQ